MYVNRKYRGGKTFVCSSFTRFGGEQCTGHYISEKTLDTVVLTVLRKVTEQVRNNPDEFIRAALAELNDADGKEEKRIMAEITATEKRLTELKALTARLFEEYALKQVMSAEQYYELSARYTGERRTLEDSIEAKRRALSACSENTDRISRYVRLARSYTDIRELTSEILHALIEKIVVHEYQADTGEREIEIFLTCGIRG